jgi:hypothetical protein
MRQKDVVAGGICLHERSAGEEGDFWLRSGLNCRRSGGQIELREARAAHTGRVAFAAHGDENGLRAAGSDARGTGIQEACNATCGDFCARAGVWTEEINALRAEMSTDELGSVGR